MTSVRRPLCSLTAATAVLVLTAGLAPSSAATAGPTNMGRPHSRRTAAGLSRAAPGASATAELTRLRAELAAAAAEAEQLAEDVFVAAARSAHLRRAMDDLAESQEAARDHLDDRIRSLYMRGRADPIAAFIGRLNNPDSSYLARRSGLSALRTDAELVAGVTAESAAAAHLRRQAETVRQDLLARAQPVLAAQDRARTLLAAAEAAAEAAAASAAAADAAAAAAAKAELAAQRTSLDAVSRSLSMAVAPAVTARGRRAAAAERPVVALIEKHCCAAPPPGFRSTGRTITGIASWYGPGFVGNPTATGAPYDPERLTAAMLAVPLGTVVRVTTDDGLAVVVLVNDRGPYVDGRVIDLSRAGSRLLGFTGVKKVTVEVLEPV
ncbi:MAG TPA: septal ring lytic transglycosylase RlpA family protein [Mycobacteriales bacterium]|nr:septal ring lytic transglycosylase RlpA family protein [Mycobacteriales bacterium]